MKMLFLFIEFIGLSLRYNIHPLSHFFTPNLRMSFHLPWLNQRYYFKIRMRKRIVATHLGFLNVSRLNNSKNVKILHHRR